MDARSDAAVAGMAQAIGEPSRARMLLALLDGRAHTGTELAVLAEVSASTASAHLHRLREQHLIRVVADGRHRYYSLQNEKVARALEGLSVLAETKTNRFVPRTPAPLRYARTCYDHMAGELSVCLHNRLLEQGWLTRERSGEGNSYQLTSIGEKKLCEFGVNVTEAQKLRRRFAYACLDWSERQPHLGGSLGLAMLSLGLENRWWIRDLNSRALHLTRAGQMELQKRLGLSAASFPPG